MRFDPTDDSLRELFLKYLVVAALDFAGSALLVCLVLFMLRYGPLK